MTRLYRAGERGRTSGGRARSRRRRTPRARIHGVRRNQHRIARRFRPRLGRTSERPHEASCGRHPREVPRRVAAVGTERTSVRGKTTGCWSEVDGDVGCTHGVSSKDTSDGGTRRREFFPALFGVSPCRNRGEGPVSRRTVGNARRRLRPPAAQRDPRLALRSQAAQELGGDVMSEPPAHVDATPSGAVRRRAQRACRGSPCKSGSGHGLHGEGFISDMHELQEGEPMRATGVRTLATARGHNGLSSGARPRGRVGFAAR
jgi:hypothetical protein